ncbi:hypothetical protein L873DRAFT_1920937 [Choiromyces venosus 120613-1]|uniref:Uncharacterized protein n=1 Tax=Choiromyces venosus 120613-1 TaxID=1336337 RepID=A0A3N4JFZ9_9PEZI|nr:hypothetical protein L873DRAFT_1920937 [Choiromyces venosus 120613-1]
MAANNRNVNNQVLDANNQGDGNIAIQALAALHPPPGWNTLPNNLLPLNFNSAVRFAVRRRFLLRRTPGYGVCEAVQWVLDVRWTERVSPVAVVNAHSTSCVLITDMRRNLLLNIADVLGAWLRSPDVHGYLGGYASPGLVEAALAGGGGGVARGPAGDASGGAEEAAVGGVVGGGIACGNGTPLHGNYIPPAGTYLASLRTWLSSQWAIATCFRDVLDYRPNNIVRADRHTWSAHEIFAGLRDVILNMAHILFLVVVRTRGVKDTECTNFPHEIYERLSFCDTYTENLDLPRNCNMDFVHGIVPLDRRQFKWLELFLPGGDYTPPPAPQGWV